MDEYCLFFLPWSTVSYAKIYIYVSHRKILTDLTIHSTTTNLNPGFILYTVTPWWIPQWSEALQNSGIELTGTLPDRSITIGKRPPRGKVPCSLLSCLSRSISDNASLFTSASLLSITRASSILAVLSRQLPWGRLSPIPEPYRLALAKS